MKTVIFSLLLLMTVNLPGGETGAQNVWYVDRDATGNNNGTSWANAWTTISSSNLATGGVNYASLSAGDTVYVSGGSDSTFYSTPNSIYSHTIYPSGAGITYASGNPVIIAPAWHAGHNGDVYIGARDNNTQWLLSIHNISNIKLTGFKFIDTRTGDYGTMLYLGGAGAHGLGIKDSLITIENSHIQGSGINSMIYMNGYKITIRNCLIEQAENSLVNDQDPFGIAGGRGGHIIEGCRIIYRNDNLVTPAHRDVIQFSDFGDPDLNEKVDMIIRNNIIAHLTDGAYWNGMIYSSNPKTDVNFYIYNNVIISSNTYSPVGAIFMYQPDPTWKHNAFIFNNTIILNTSPENLTLPINITRTDSIIVKNNLVIMDGSPNYFLSFTPRPTPTYFREVNYNGYYEPGGLSGNFYPGEDFGAWTYAQWQAAGWDLNSISGNSTAVTFDNKYGEYIEGYYTETGRGLGVNMVEAHPWLYQKFPDIAYDALGNPRTGPWDIGALQYQGASSNYINLQGKVFLQGAFDSNSMTTFLSQNSLLPASQPYNTAPWNYSGNEVLSSGSSSGIVDWVLIELRSSNNPSQVVARRAAVLKDDGSLLDTDGSTGVRFNNVQDGTYYIVVKHRNHLAVMSAAPVQLSSNSEMYDFTNSMNKAFGNNPMADLGGAGFGMYSGDGNGDGGINIFDKNVIWQSQNGTMGYLGGDFDLDGGVTANDVNLHWNINNGTMTQVP